MDSVGIGDVDGMTVEQRIRRCLILEKMNKSPRYGKKLGLVDVSNSLLVFQN